MKPREWEPRTAGPEVHRPVVTADDEQPVRGSNVTAPRPLSWKGLAPFLGLLALSAVALALFGYKFWTERVVHRPTAPIVQGLLLLVLALTWAGMAVMRLTGTIFRKRPLWWSILVMLAAGYLLVHAASYIW